MTTRRPPPPVVLLTGFAPFGGDAGNPSREIAFALHGRRIAGHRIVARELPVAFGASLRALRGHVREQRPALVVCLGLAGGRERISLERIAINVDDARIPDNAGAQPVDIPVVPGGPPAYFSTLPIKAMLAALHDAGIPAEVSQTAGTFVCNHVFYGLMHALRARPAVRGGFVHVPHACDSARPGAAGRARGLPLPLMIEGVRIALRTALATGDDVRIAAGAID